MNNFNVIYLPIGVPTFHMESAYGEFNKSLSMLKEIYSNIIHPKEPLLSIDDLKDFIEDLNPDLLIIQNITFANSAYISEIVRYNRDIPILLWTLREPVIDGGRLRLNSLTGAYSCGNLLKSIGIFNFEYIYGSPSESEVISKIEKSIKVCKFAKNLKSINIASIGQTPEGFGFGRALDSEILNYFGCKLIAIESRELMNIASKYEKNEYDDILKSANNIMIGLENLPSENVDSFARLYKAYSEFIEKNNVKAIASRCWPDYFVEYGTPVCAVLGMLNDNLIAASCESDLLGALSMLIGIEFSKNPVFFGDPVSLDEEINSITFWHCGMSACSLARSDTGATMGVHPNRKIGPTMEFGLKPQKDITLFRIGRKNNGSFRFFIANGEALDEPKQFLGTSVVVKTENDSKKLVELSVKDGWEPHFVIIYKDIKDELKILGKLLNIEICEY